jgi:hypothetical protein
MIVTLPERIAALPPERQQICAALFDVAVLRGRAEPPPSMWPWVEQQFGSLDAVRNQTSRWRPRCSIRCGRVVRWQCTAATPS